MKQSTATFIAGAVAGAVVATGGVITALMISGKKLFNKKKAENDKFESTLKKVQSTLTGTEYEELSDKFISIIKNASNTFSKDRNVIAEHIETILDSNKSKETKFQMLANYVAGLDLLSDSVDTTVEECFEDALEVSEVSTEEDTEEVQDN